MIGSLYKITNSITGESYIGKTYRTVQYRYNAHKRDASRFPHRPLYKAINEYGFDNFSVETLGTFAENELERQEELAIEKFNTFESGYNATLGGDGRRYRVFDESHIVELYEKGFGIKQIALQLKTCSSTISSILKSNNVDPSKGNYKKRIYIKDVDMEFTSVSECAKFLIEAEVATGSYRAVTLGINKAVSGDRKSYLGFEFATVL